MNSGAKRQQQNSASFGHLIEEEREHFQRRGIGPVRSSQAQYTSFLLCFFHDPRYQGFLGLLFLFLGTQG